MMPYYEESGVVIYNADCREVLDSLQVDVVVTDPPFGVEGGHGGQLYDYRKADYLGEWKDDAEYVQNVCAPVILRLTQRQPTVVLTPGTRCNHFYHQPDDIGCFYAPANPRKGRFGFATCTPIYYYGWYKQSGKGHSSTSYVLVESSEQNGHPCPKPIKAWKWLVERVSEDGALVLDPFMGSGTTLVAAKDLNRRAIGIEIEEKYCEIAANRLRQSVMHFGAAK